MEKQIAEFQKKVNENAFLNADRANEEYERIKKADSNMEAFADSIAADLKKQQEETDLLIEELIISKIKEYNLDKKYKIIYNSSGLNNILYADEEYNITSDFLEFINQRDQR